MSQDGQLIYAVSNLARASRIEGHLPFRAGSFWEIVGTAFIFLVLDAVLYPIFGALGGVIAANLLSPGGQAMNRVSRDIRATALPPLDWDPAKRVNSMLVLVEHAVSRAEQAAEWYLSAKSSMRLPARSLRLGAILLTAAAGILPIIQQIYTASDGKPVIAPAWASVLVAVAVLFIAVDRFFGFSSSWMRYITAELAIRQARETFELDWQAAYASYGSHPPTDDQVRAVITMIKTFIDQINAVVANETAKWVGEFQEALRQIDETTKNPVPVVQTGSLALTVENGDAVDAPGWALSLDHGAPVSYTGKTAALSGLESRDHVVRVTAKISANDVRAEDVVQVRPGVIARLQVSLA